MMIKWAQNRDQRLAELPSIKSGKDKETMSPKPTTTKVTKKKQCLNLKKSSEKAPISVTGQMKTYVC